jgi:predicted XRE-type DNA-binding protein
MTPRRFRRSTQRIPIFEVGDANRDAAGNAALVRAQLRAAILTAHAAGASQALIAEVAGYSRSRVSQIVAESD